MSFVPTHEIEPDTSERIKILRFILITGLVFIHIPPGGDLQAYGISSRGFLFVKTLLSDVAFMGVLPVLSVISGYLFGQSTSNYRTLIAKKIRSLLTPMVLWNLSVVLLVVIVQAMSTARAEGMAGHAFSDLNSFFNAILALNRIPANAPLYFLRDLFVCFLCAPGFLLLARNKLTVTMALGGFLLAALFEFETYIWIRVSIAMWFFMGVALAVHQARLSFIDRHKRSIWVFFVIAVLSLTWAKQDGAYLTYPVFRRLLIVIRFLALPACWALAGSLVKHNAGRRCAQWSETSFFLFCIHSPLLLIMWNVWAFLVPVEQQATLYPLYYFIAWLTAVIMSIVTFKGLQTFCPGFLAVLDGGRKRRS